MSEEPRGQLDLEAVEQYEERLVSSVFAAWAPLLVDAAGVQVAQHVLDVGCCTGILARTAGERVGRLGKVTGLDESDTMLTVARRRAPRAAWHRGDAGDMPFADGVFDAVLCQASLACFDDRASALHEMARVAHSSGVVAVQVFGESPGHELAAQLIEDIAGAERAEDFRAPFALADADDLVSLLTAAGLEADEVRTLERPARYPSLEDFASTDLEGRALAGRVDGDDLLAGLRDRLEPFVDETGALVLPMEGHIATASKGGGSGRAG